MSKNNILKIYWVRIILICSVLYGCLELYVGYGSNICGNDVVVLEDWLQKFQYSVLGGYIALIVYDLFSVLNANEDTRYIHAIVLLINVLSATTEALVINSWGGVCVDKFGVATFAAAWPLLFVTFPLLAFAAFGANTKRISRSEQMTVIMLACVVVVAFAANIDAHTMLPQKILTIVAVGFTTWSLYGVSKANIAKHAVDDSSSGVRSNQIVSIRALSQNMAKSNMSFMFILLCPLVPCVYVLAIYGYLTQTVTLALMDAGTAMLKIMSAITLIGSYTRSLSYWKDAVRRQEINQENRRAYLRSVFHDVRVPLNSIVMGMDLVEAQLGRDADKSVITMMREASQFMADTLNDVLSIEKCEAGQMELELRPFDLHRMIERVSGAVGIQTSEKGLAISVDIAKNVPVVLIGDKFRLEHVVANLVSNAIKFSQKGTIVIKASVSEEDYFPPAPLSPAKSDDVLSTGTPTSAAAGQSSSGGRFTYNGSTTGASSNSSSGNGGTNASNYVQDSGNDDADIDLEDIEVLEGSPIHRKVTIAVIDEGPGIRPDDLASLFQAFVQIRPGLTQGGQGTGLGLSLCKQIVELHGGHIGCTSTLGVGSTFSFTIPFKIPRVRRKTKATSGPDSAAYGCSTTGSSSSRRVVVAPNVLSSLSGSIDHSIQAQSSSSSKLRLPVIVTGTMESSSSMSEFNSSNISSLCSSGSISGSGVNSNISSTPSTPPVHSPEVLEEFFPQALPSKVLVCDGENP
jgi:signal transduction histidine kinase